ncbi:Mediator of RNA polymerase II transcription subunit 6 [Lamellibrachia satsuma]|nr:Mediator of RNA polymerase II transcription subunit 6 [Lamellibrachia satsuma]
MSTGISSDTQLAISWYDSAWIPVLNPGNILDYFAERSNPFYDRTCNNEIVRMQRLSSEQLNNMTGLEYILLHVQEPILYVIRKQHRHSHMQVTPLADYNIIAGVVYQAPDLGSIINSRLLNTTHNLQSAFKEAQDFSRYHPSRGYWWEFKDSSHTDKLLSKEKKKKEEPSSLFQRQRVDELLAELGKKFPPKYPPTPASTQQVPEKQATGDGVKLETKMEIKTDADTQPPPEKKTKVMGS